MNFTKEDGLPSERILFVTSSPDGVIYFGSWNDGAGRYDPKTFISYNMADGLAANPTWDSFLAADGAVWFGRNSASSGLAPVEGVSRFDGKQFSTFAETNRIIVPGSLAQTPDGALWLPAFDGGVIRFDGTNFIRFSAAEGLVLDRVFAMAAVLDGSVWAGTANGLSHRVNGRWQSFPCPEGKQITANVSDSKGTIWARSTVNIGLSKASFVWRFDGASFQPLGGLSGLLNNSLFIDRDDSLWLGTDAGAVRFEGQKLTRISKSKGRLAHNNVQCVYRDRQNVLWFGTRAGATRFDGAVWSTLTKVDGLAGSDVRTICEDQSGALWFGTDRGVTRYVASRVPAPPPRVTVLLDKTYEPGAALPSIERGRRVDLEIHVVDHKTRSELRRFRWQIIPGRVTAEALRDGAPRGWQVLTEPQFVWNALETGEHTLAVQYIDCDWNYSLPTLVPLRIIPPWHLNAWIMGPFGGTTGGLLIWAFVARSMVVRRKHEAEQLRERLLEEEHKAREGAEASALALAAKNTQLEAASKTADDARTAAEEAKAMADDANKAKSQFLANMSHELRTPPTRSSVTRK